MIYSSENSLPVKTAVATAGVLPLQHLLSEDPFDDFFLVLAWQKLDGLQRIFRYFFSDILCEILFLIDVMDFLEDNLEIIRFLCCKKHVLLEYVLLKSV